MPHAARADHNAYFREYNRRRAEQRKAALIERLGGQCAVCGRTDDLEFDHVDPLAKKFAITKRLLMRWDLLIVEADKCQLLCRTCHRKKTNEEITTRAQVAAGDS